jgi:hypothetical protein
LAAQEGVGQRSEEGSGRPVGLGLCRFGLPAKAQGGGGQWAGLICGKIEKSIPNLIFGLTRILEIESRSFWGQEGLVKIPKNLQNFIGILEMKTCELERILEHKKMGKIF